MPKVSGYYINVVEYLRLSTGLAKGISELFKSPINSILDACWKCTAGPIQVLMNVENKICTASIRVGKGGESTIGTAGNKASWCSVAVHPLVYFHHE